MTGGPTAAPRRAAGAARLARCVITVCRGCCCGSQAKHPDVDHPGQFHQLRDQTGASLLRLSDCLDACERSNVMVVTPSPAGRRAGAGPSGWARFSTPPAPPRSPSGSRWAARDWPTSHRRSARTALVLRCATSNPVE